MARAIQTRAAAQQTAGTLKAGACDLTGIRPDVRAPVTACTVTPGGNRPAVAVTFGSGRTVRLP